MYDLVNNNDLCQVLKQNINKIGFGLGFIIFTTIKNQTDETKIIQTKEMYLIQII